MRFLFAIALVGCSEPPQMSAEPAPSSEQSQEPGPSPGGGAGSLVVGGSGTAECVASGVTFEARLAVDGLTLDNFVSAIAKFNDADTGNGASVTVRDGSLSHWCTTQDQAITFYYNYRQD